MKGIKVSRIVNGELKYIEGYSWKTDEETEEQFNIMKKKKIDYNEGEICLDLIDSNDDILETITITSKEFARIRG